MTDVDLILAHMDANPGTSAKQAAEALGLPPRSARAAKKARNASRAPTRTDGAVVQLAPTPVGRDPSTESLVEFWTMEIHEIYGRRQDASGIAYNNCTRDLHTARRELEAARAAEPSKPPGESDAELIADLAAELGITVDEAARMVG